MSGPPFYVSSIYFYRSLHIRIDYMKTEIYFERLQKLCSNVCMIFIGVSTFHL